MLNAALSPSNTLTTDHVAWQQYFFDVNPLHRGKLYSSEVSDGLKYDPKRVDIAFCIAIQLHFMAYVLRLLTPLTL